MQIVTAICGVKNSGKTTLIEKIVPKLTARNLKVAYVKHDGHDFECDIEGTDSHRVSEAGAYGTAVYSSVRLFVHQISSDSDCDKMLEMFPDADVVLIEGMKHSSYPKIELVRKGISEDTVSNPDGRFLIVSDLDKEWGERSAGFDDIDAIVDMILFENRSEAVPVSEDGPYTAAWITLSDKGYRGEREDKSGPVIDRMLRESGYEVVESLLLPDEEMELRRELIRLADQRRVNLILTTGGTGFAMRDRTPEATIAVCDRMAPGIAEAMRAYSMAITPRAMLSRAVSGIRKQTLIVNLPGSPKAVQENLEYILPNLEHGLELLRGTGGECAR